MADCGTDAHRHVANCRSSLQPGIVWGTQEQFNAAHVQRRTDAVRQYLATAVTPAHRPQVQRAIAKDL